MNKQVLFVLFALFAFASATAATAQPTLTAATNNPVVGNIYIEHKADTAGRTPGAAGAAVTWNFATLTQTGVDTTRYISCAATTYCDSFPGANIVAASTLGYMFGTTSATGYKLLGSYQDTTLMHFSDPQNALSYPITYNTIQADTMVTSFGSGPMPIDLTRYDKTVADGYGTLKLPSGNYANVLRLRIASVNMISITLPDTVLTDTTYSESYAWYAAGFHSPLLVMSYDSTEYGMEISGISWYTKPGALAVDRTTVQKTGITIYPNPATHDINIEYNALTSGAATVTLKDITGRITITWNELLRADNNHLHYSLPELPSGMYILSIQTENDLMSEKMMINN